MVYETGSYDISREGYALSADHRGAGKSDPYPGSENPMGEL